MVTPLKDVFLVSADEEQNSKTKSGLFIDVSWDKYKHAVQNGIVVQAPMNISSVYRKDVEIKNGDKIYFHHFVCQADNYIMDEGRKLFKAQYFQIYCKIENGTPLMLEDFILASPIYEKEEDIQKKIGDVVIYLKASPDKLHSLAKAEHLSKQAKEEGLKEGDIIIYKRDADYEMTIEDKVYYRMKLANVAGVIRDGNIVPIRDEATVETTNQNEKVRNSGIIMINQKPEKTQRGKICSKGIKSDFNIGDEVLYFYGSGTPIEYGGKKFSILRQEEIMGLVQEEVLA